jgi:NitT/TauT family transport system substrate-binding protein
MTVPMLTRRGLGLATLATALPAAVRAQAPTELTIAATPAAADAPIAVALQEGLFTREGLAVKVVVIPLMPSVPPAVVSNSAQIGYMTTPTFLQAVDGGLDLIAVLGGAVTDQKVHDIAVLVRPGTTIDGAAGFIGKKVGVPGIGAFFHVMFSYWLMQKGVDPSKVNFIEVTFPQMGDALRGGSVDAVLIIEPFLSQVVGSGVGKIAVPIAEELPNDKPEVFFCALREWAYANPKTVNAFRRAMTSAEEMVNKDRPMGVKAVVSYLKMPPAVAPHVAMETLDPNLKQADLEWWVDVLMQQKFLSKKLDVSKLVWTG